MAGADKPWLAGDYEAAGKALSYKPTLSAFDTSTNSNNRCVSLTVTKQWDAAKTACDKAVRDAEREKATLPSFEAWAQNAQDSYIAVALSNRAVMHWMADESDAAAADLEARRTARTEVGHRSAQQIGSRVLTPRARPGRCCFQVKVLTSAQLINGSRPIILE